MKSFAEIRFPIIVCIVAACTVIGCSPYKKTQQSILTVHTDIDSIPQYRKLLIVSVLDGEPNLKPDGKYSWTQLSDQFNIPLGIVEVTMIETGQKAETIEISTNNRALGFRNVPERFTLRASCSGYETTETTVVMKELVAQKPSWAQFLIKSIPVYKKGVNRENLPPFPFD